MSWVCPFAEKSKYFEKRLLCKKEIKEGINYAEGVNFATAMCLYQQYCGCKSEYLNSEQAKKCYEIKKNK